jgi:hypothetical protein
MRLCKVIALIVITTLTQTACEREHTLTPEEVGARRLTEIDGLGPQEHSALQAAIGRLASEGAEAADFYLGPIEKRSDTLLELPLWYKSAFEGPMVVGNPGGKSRTMVYDIERNTIVEDLLWQ